MTYIENELWKTAEKNGNLRAAIISLYDELAENYDLVEAKEPSKHRTVVRTLYHGITYKSHTVKTYLQNYSDTKIQTILEDLKVVRSYIIKEMKKIK